MAEILAIQGSARRGGNSDSLLGSALGALQKAQDGSEIETLTASELDITPCRSCHGCWETGICVIDDRMQQVYRQCLEAEHIIVSAPVYFTSLPGQLKVMIDRFQCFWVRTYRLGSPPRPRRSGMFLCIGAMDDTRFFDSASLIIRTWMSTLNMKCKVARFYHGLDAPGDFEHHPDYLKDAAAAAKELKG